MKIIDWIKSLFSRALRVFKSLIDAALPVARQIIVGQLAELAMDVVKDLANKDLSNEDKRQEAFNIIKSHAVQNGIEARDSLVNWLIETSVLRWKSDF